MYQCVAGNKYGEVYSNAELRVIGKIVQLWLWVRVCMHSFHFAPSSSLGQFYQMPFAPSVIGQCLADSDVPYLSFSVCKRNSSDLWGLSLCTSFHWSATFRRVGKMFRLQARQKLDSRHLQVIRCNLTLQHISRLYGLVCVGRHGNDVHILFQSFAINRWIWP